LFFSLKICYTFNMNDSRRLLKQIFIAIVYLVIFSGIGTGVYFLTRPTPMSTSSAPTIYPIQIIWAQPFTSGSDVYSVGAKITNTNFRFGSDRFTYTFYFYSATNELLTARSGTSFIWPGESKYLIEAGINGLSDAPATAKLEIGAPNWNEIQDFKSIDLTASNINHGKGTAGSGKFYAVDFTVFNNTSYSLRKVYVSAVIYDKNNFPIAVNSTVLENLQSKERRAASIPWFSPFPGTPNSVILNISTNLGETPELIGQ